MPFTGPRTLLSLAVITLTVTFIPSKCSGQEPYEPPKTVKLVFPFERSRSSAEIREEKERKEREINENARIDRKNREAENERQRIYSEPFIVYKRAQYTAVMQRREEEAKKWDAAAKAKVEAMWAKYGKPKPDHPDAIIRSK